MRRHHIAITLALAAALWIPAIGSALPRPNLANQSEGPTQVGGYPEYPGPIPIYATDSLGKYTPFLVAGRKYTLQISETWRPNTSLTNDKADAACETTNGTSWSHTGKGLFVGSTNLGALNSTVQCDQSNNYSFDLIGHDRSELLRIFDTDANYSALNNSGSLKVKIFTYTTVTYDVPIASQSLPGATASQTVLPTTTVTPGTVGPVTVPPVTVQGVVIPQLATIAFYHDNRGRWCIDLTANNQTTPISCVFDPGQAVGQPLKDTSITIGGNTVYPGTSLGPYQLIPGVPLPPITIPGVGVSTGIPPGSKAQITLSWRADRTHLWKTQVNDYDSSTNSETTALWAPFKYDDSGWFLGQVQQGNLALSVQVVLTDSNGQKVGNFPTLSIPGMGQVIEAGFTTEVADNVVCDPSAASVRSATGLAC